MKWFLLFFLLFVSLILESTITTLPLVLIVLFVATVVFNTTSVFLLSFIWGVILDTLTFQILGVSSGFFILFLTCAFLYERKFEIRSIPFILVFSFIGSLFYCLLFGYHYIVFQAVISMFIAFILFYLLQKFPL